MVNVEEPDLMSGAGHSLLQDYKRRCYENKDNNDLFHKWKRREWVSDFITHKERREKVINSSDGIKH